MSKLFFFHFSKPYRPRDPNAKTKKVAVWCVFIEGYYVPSQKVAVVGLLLYGPKLLMTGSGL